MVKLRYEAGRGMHFMRVIPLQDGMAIRANVRCSGKAWAEFTLAVKVHGNIRNVDKKEDMDATELGNRQGESSLPTILEEMHGCVYISVGDGQCNKET